MSERNTSTSRPGSELKPHRFAFLLPRVAPWVLVLMGGCGIFFAVGLGAENLPMTGGSVAVFLVGSLLALWAGNVAWRKERYEVHTSHLICRRGGVFSDQSTELDVRNITHVKLRLPWLRHMIFGTGDVMIDSAGSGTAEIHLRAIARPDVAYAAVRELMQANGYALKQEQLLHEERPDLIGVLLECGGIFVGAIAVIAISIADRIAEVEGDITLPVMILIGCIAGVVLLGLIGGICVHFLDMRRRTYRVFEDAVVYEEGFLTRDNAFMPSENIADGSTKRTLIDQIVGLYDVQVSCQGSGQEIRFRRLRRGRELANAIDQLVANQQGKPRPGRSAPAPSAERAVEDARAPRPGLPEPVLVPSEEAWTTELRMSLPRAILGTLPLIVIPPLFVLAAIATAIRVHCTRFSVRSGSIRSAYRFLTVNEREFAYDKVTAVVVRRNPFDSLLKTFSLQVWSIGAAQPMDLPYLRRDDVNLPALLRQVGIGAEPCLAEIPARFSLVTWVKARLPLAIALLLSLAALALLGELVNGWFHAGAAAVGLATVGGLAYSHLFYARQRFGLHSQHVEVQTGVVLRSHYHTLYRNVKRVVQTRYPLTHIGSIQLFVAGERTPELKNRKARPAAPSGVKIAVPYSFTAAFIEDISGKLVALDRVLGGEITADRIDEPESSAPDSSPPLAEGRPALANRMTMLLILCVLAVPIVFLPITIPWLILDVRRRSYRVEGTRIVSSWGILYRAQSSVLFERIDSLRHEQGFLGKVFKNGHVIVFTAGSSSPDLVLKDLRDYQGFYAAIRENYGRD